MRGLSTAAVVLLLTTSAGAAPFAWIASQFTNDVARLDLATNESLVVPVGLYPLGAAGTPDGSRGYVVNSPDGTVSVVDVASASVVATVPVGGFATGVAVTPDGSKAYVTHDTESVSVIETAGNTVVKTLLVGGFTAAVVVNAAGTRVYVGKRENSNGSVVVIDTATDTVIADILVSTSGGSIYGLALDPTGPHGYASALATPAVFQFSTATNVLENTIPLACDDVCPSPVSLAVTPDGAKVYATEFQLPRVAVVDPVGLSEIRTVPVGYQPFGIDITPDGTRAYVVNENDDSISVIDTANDTVVQTLLTLGHGPTGYGHFIVPGSTTTTTTTTTTSSTTTTTLPHLSGAARTCQTALAASYKRYGTKAHKLLASCLDRALRDLANGVELTGAANSCAGSLAPGDPTSSLSKARIQVGGQIAAHCVGVLPADVNHPCDAAASTVAATVDCVLTAQVDLVTRTIAAEYADACALLQAVGQATAFPAACSP